MLGIIFVRRVARKSAFTTFDQEHVDFKCELDLLVKPEVISCRKNAQTCRHIHQECSDS